MNQKQAVVLVTGASAGIGRAICEVFLANQFIVIGVACRQNLLKELEEQFPQQFYGVACNLCDTSKLEMLINQLPCQLKDVTILINNAGLAQNLKPIHKCEQTDLQKMVDLNVVALINLTQKVAAFMAQNNCGHVINISSIAGNAPYYGGNVYCATKAFVTMFSQCLRADLIQNNIKVTNIEPGLVGETEFSYTRYHGNQTLAEKTYQNTEYLLAQDIAETVWFAANMPSRVNVSRIEIIANSQTPSGYLTIKKIN